MHADGAGLFEEGTYTAVAPGRNGDVVVTVTSITDEIAAVECEHDETPTLGGAAIDSLTEHAD